jgi:signal peptidase
LLAAIGWKLGLKSRPAPSRQLVVTSVLVGLFQVALLVIAGLLYGFGRSPYGHSLMVVLGNLLYVGTMLIAAELSRAYLVRLFGRANPGLGVGVTGFIFAYLNIPLATYSSAIGPAAFMRFSGETFLPTLSESLLASFLAFLAGPAASIAYRSVPLAFEWLSPILPDLAWMVTAFIGTMAPALGLLAVRSQLALSSAGEAGPGVREKGPSTGWLAAVALATALLWFNTGLFGYRPTLVSGVSMQPALVVGDIVITREVQANQVQVGDIIRYRQGDTFIIHRVVDVNRQGGSTFITKGDANNAQDAPVSPGELEGKVILIIPKLGWLSIGVRNLLSALG